MSRAEDLARVAVVVQLVLWAMASPTANARPEATESEGEVIETSLALPGTWGVKASALLVGTYPVFPKDDYAKVTVRFAEDGVLKANFFENKDIGEIWFERVPWGFCNLVTIKTQSEKDRLKEILLTNPVLNLYYELLGAALSGGDPGKVLEGAQGAVEMNSQEAFESLGGLPDELKRLTVRYDLCYWVRDKSHMPKEMNSETRQKTNWFLAVVGPDAMWSSTMAEANGAGMVQWHQWSRIGE